MHLVTKILIVFAALFAVLLAALAISFSYNAQRLRESIDAERADKTAAVAALNEAQTAWQKEIANAKQASEQAVARVNAMQNDYSTIQNERSQLQAKVRTTELERDAYQNESKGKDARLDTLTKLTASLNEENAKLRSEFLRLSREGTEKDVRLADLESQNLVAIQNQRSLQEQMADMVAAANKASASTSNTRGGTEYTAGPLVTAKVTKITKAPSGEDLATISAGS
ncbi:MAG TPA: hypothetical protein VEB22_06245, partial [Phycisphaerales bacterium]|nr:hypothetical protein [Phycisphaerales bacterium]